VKKLPYICTDKRNGTDYTFDIDMDGLIEELFPLINNSSYPQDIKDGWNKIFIEHRGVQELHDEVVVFN